MASRCQSASCLWSPDSDSDICSVCTLLNSGHRPLLRAWDNPGQFMAPKDASAAAKSRRQFDVEAYLESAGPARNVVKYRAGDVVFSQGDPANDVRYLQKGTLRLSVLSQIGKEAVVAMLGPGEFFGEGALAGQLIRIGTATAISAATVRVIDKDALIRLLRHEPTFSNRFLSYMLTRNIRIE